ncbi:penicillin-binding protein 1A [Aquimarina intermedia]|uniref:Penicillin-binding protein 1A n=1 Tax=Aquimarina intermedia TaxID=350814 RepID=A0A5S5BXM1_9FLAO|nr:transglycosylase domain-containing protein [Aquimarina intermedia]TYP70890.1 penicillin-binding protein 1A [Aquimarina intermedia]
MQTIKRWLQNPWIKWSLVGITGLLVLLIAFYISIYAGAWGTVPTAKTLSTLKQAEATQVLDKNGELIGKYYIYDRQPITFDDLPRHLIDALIATEDVRFYEHEGIDNKSLLRVFFKSILLQDKSSGGGSTITLQLAKNLFGRKDYGKISIIVNKLKESIIASRIEAIYSKNEILTLYFNTVPFPDNTYGIESAAQKFFNKSTKELNLSEAAVLVGSLKANNGYNPRLYPERSQSRRDVVLQQMVKYEYLDEDRASSTMQDTIALDYQHFNHDMGVAPYFREVVKKQLDSLLKNYKNENGDPYNIYSDGLIIHTTLDYQMQTLAETAMQEHMRELQAAYEKDHGNRAPWKKELNLKSSTVSRTKAYKKLKANGLSESQLKDSLRAKREMELFEWEGNVTEKASTLDSLQHYRKFLNTGMLSIDPTTGAVLSYIGGIDYRYFKYDHVSQSKRQVGSTFKPFVYTAAIDNGMKPCTYFPVRAVTYTNVDDWTPTNASETEDPYLNYTLETALSNSINTIAVKVLNKVGIPKVIELVKKLGITSEIPEQPSIALGTAGITLKEMAGAFASYVNQGKSVTPYLITKIADKNGTVLAEYNPKIAEEAAYTEYTREVVLEMMKATVDEGTAARLRTTYGLSNDIAGKTGTTQDNKDGWFVGITPRLVSVTWVGNDDYAVGFKSTRIGQGANAALPIFAKLYTKMNTDTTFDRYTKSKFDATSPEVRDDLDCEPEKRDNFLKRLFSGKKKKKRFKKEKNE